MTSDPLFDGVRARNRRQTKRHAQKVLRQKAASCNGVKIQRAEFDGQEFVLEYELDVDTQDEFAGVMRTVASAFIGVHQAFSLNFGDLVARVTMTSASSEDELAEHSWDAGDAGEWRVPSGLTSDYTAGELSDADFLEHVAETFEEASSP